MKKIIQLDTEILADLFEIEKAGEAGLLDLLVESYSTQAPALLSHLQKALNEKNLEALERTAHSFKSSSAGLGARDLAKVLAELEHKAEDRAPLEECAQLVFVAGELIPPTLIALRDIVPRAA